MKLGRNQPCHCGSGIKYKKCCLPKEEQDAQQKLIEENDAWEAWFKKDCAEGQRNLVDADMKKYLKDVLTPNQKVIIVDP